jgi:hypothetical protein
MSTKAQVILDQIRGLPPEDLRAIWQAVNSLVPSDKSPPVVVHPSLEAGQNDDNITLEEETHFLEALEEARGLWGSATRNLPEFE